MLAWDTAFRRNAAPRVVLSTPRDTFGTTLPCRARRPPRSPPAPLPASQSGSSGRGWRGKGPWAIGTAWDRKSTRLNSSHQLISYAVFCLKKKKKKDNKRKEVGQKKENGKEVERQHKQ